MFCGRKKRRQRQIYRQQGLTRAGCAESQTEAEMSGEVEETGGQRHRHATRVSDTETERREKPDGSEMF